MNNDLTARIDRTAALLMAKFPNYQSSVQVFRTRDKAKPRLYFLLDWNYVDGGRCWFAENGDLVEHELLNRRPLPPGTRLIIKPTFADRHRLELVKIKKLG